jgi:hypothetical protein
VEPSEAIPAPMTSEAEKASVPQHASSQAKIGPEILHPGNNVLNRWTDDKLPV